MKKLFYWLVFASGWLFAWGPAGCPPVSAKPKGASLHIYAKRNCRELSRGFLYCTGRE